MRPLTLLLTLAALTATAQAPTWKLGMSTVLSGPSQALGQHMKHGVEAYFAWKNAAGGVHGRPLELVALDDGYEPARAASNMRTLIDQHQVFSVIGNVRTPTAAVTVPIANEKQVPLFGAFTGAGLLRKSPPDRYVVNFRASYAEETAEMVRGLVTELGIAPAQLAFFTQNDAYGDAGFNGAVQALKALGYADAARLPHGRYPRNTVDVEDAVSRLIDPRVRPRAVIMVGAYKPCAKFIKLARQRGLDALFVNVSFVGSEALLRELGPEGDGVVVTQVVPLLDRSTALVKEFEAAVAPDARNFISLEGFAAARAFTVILEATGPQATRETFLDTLERGVPVDLGFGAPVALSPKDHQLSHRVWPTVIRRQRFVPVEQWRSLRGGGVL